MKRRSAVLTAFCLSSAAIYGQQLGKTIFLPGSAGGLTSPQCVVYNTKNNTIYVGGQYGECVVVVDARTMRRIARIPTGRDVKALCYDENNNRVYCANNASNTVTVIDGTENAVIATVEVGVGPFAICCDPKSNTVYCANYGHYPQPGPDSSVTVIDGSSNRVTASIRVGCIPAGLCYSSEHNLVYCTDAYDDQVTVIDGSTHKIVGTLSQQGCGGSLCYNPVDDRVYCSRGAIIAAATSTVDTTINTGEEPGGTRLCLDSTKQLVFRVGACGSVSTIDCATDKLLTNKLGMITLHYPLPSSGSTGRTRGISAICADPKGDRVYSTADYGADMYAVDVNTWAVTDSVKLGGFPQCLCCVPGENLVFCFDAMDRGVRVFHSDGNLASEIGADKPLYYDSIYRRVYCGRTAVDLRSKELHTSLCLPGERYAGDVTAICGNTVNGMLYYLYASGKIVGVNQRDGAVTTMPDFRDRIPSFCYDPKGGVLYCASDQLGAIFVVDGVTNQVVDTIPMTGLLSYSPSTRKVYCASYGSVSTIDCITRRVTATAELVANPARVVGLSDGTDTITFTVENKERPCCLCSVASDSSMYCAGDELNQVYIIGGASDSVEAALHVGKGGHLLCYSAYTNRVYCTNSSDNTVSVIDASTRKVIKTLDVGDMPLAIECDSREHVVYVANSFGASISVIHDE